MPADSSLDKLRKFNTLSLLHHQIASNTEFEQIARIALRELLDVFKCDYCAILYISEGSFTVLAEKGFIKVHGSLGSIRDIPALNYVVTTGQSLSTGKTQVRLQSGHTIPEQSSNSVLCTPIPVKDTVRGIIYIASRVNNAFDTDDSDYTKIVARELSKAFKNSFPFRRSDSKSLFAGTFKPLTQHKFDRDLITQIANAEWERKPLSLLMINTEGLIGNTFNRLSLNKPDTENIIIKILNTSLRPLDSIYRYGNSDLAVLLPETTKNNALSIAERLKRVIESQATIQMSLPEHVPVQIGVSNFPADADYRDGLVRKAHHYQTETDG